MQNHAHIPYRQATLQEVLGSTAI
ncbi:hypothetical protein TIFTF001_056706 [Ficus carica]|uniref:Uncharacterized protein n=1 Tax=Ficus carica TaxID=3494 RepID=A0AA88JFV0_FICCA|nr:hypothetical protein TIFTF001_056706 [Ficus carica]